jgi:hypothetical protein
MTTAEQTKLKKRLQACGLTDVAADSIAFHAGINAEYCDGIHLLLDAEEAERLSEKGTMTETTHQPSRITLT